MAELSVIVPTLNDASVLPDTVLALNETVGRAGIATELLIVDGGSTDTTQRVATELANEYPALHTRVLLRSSGGRPLGFGSMVRYGVAYSSGRFCAVVAADGSDPVALLPAMVGELRNNKQLVICSRYSEPRQRRRVATRFRIYQIIYRRAIRLGLRREIPDSTNGFRAFDRKYVQALGFSSNRFSICPEISFKVLLSGGALAFVAGQPQGTPGQVAPKFALPHEIVAYAYVLARAWLHQVGIPWF